MGHDRRRRAPKAAKKPSLRERWQQMLRSQAGRRPRLLSREVAGCVLLILAALTILGLSHISSGTILTWWAAAVRRVFGWGAYPVTLGVGLLGLQLLWRDLAEWTPLRPRAWVGLELLLVVVLVASHAPLVLRQGADEAFVAAELGKAGGYVGWALAVPLMETLGAVVGSVVLLVGFVVALWLLLPVSWQDVREWGQHQGRLVTAALSRWQAARQGTPVLPERTAVPWWEEEPEPSEPKHRQTRRATGRKPIAPGLGAKPGRAKPRDGGLPPLSLLDPVSPRAYGDTDVRRKIQIIEETLASFAVPARVIEVNQGPTVTQFGLDPGYLERRAADGQTQRQRVRVARIASLSNDLALALSASPLRIEAPVPGRPLVGLEVPNEKVSLVSLRGVMETPEFRKIKSRLAIALGEDVSGHPMAVDLALMPHLLIAGATGSGKSVCINAIICCLLCNNRPDELKLLMIDPKMVELIGYNDIPHLLAPVVIDVEHVVGALAWVTRQMDERYRLFHESGVRNLEQYNLWVGKRKAGEPLPVLVILIDELADLMMMAPDEVEHHIIRVAQKGRATGIHLVVATQRPSVDVVTGLIKANFPARISFAVTSLIDSRVILDVPGAENLLGRGDMLFLAPQLASPLRVQGCFVSDEEIERLAEFWRSQGLADEQTAPAALWAGFEDEDQVDDLLEKAIRLINGRERVSTSFIQRQLRIGFPRAARLMDQLEDQGFVGPDEGAGRGRQVLGGIGLDLDGIDERLPGVKPDEKRQRQKGGRRP